MNLSWLGIIIIGFLWNVSVYAEPISYPLAKVEIDAHDKPSLQRGARLYVNYCIGCHSLGYMRYNQLAQGLGLVNKQGQPDAKLLANLIFTNARSTDLMLSSLSASDSKNWFGVIAPDLTLETRVRGPNWVYTYLRSFYRDPARPWGTNNLIFPDVAMPNVLANLQGIQVPSYRDEVVIVDNEKVRIHYIDHVELIKPGIMTPLQFDSAMADVVNFLAYVAEPMQLERHRIGKWVLLFLFVFAILTYFLNRNYWKNIN